MAMQETEELQEYVSGLANLDLWEMWSNSEGYEAAARQIAEREFQRRDISHDEIEAIRAQSESRNLTAEDLTSIPLPWGWRICFGVIAITLLSAIVVGFVARSFQASGKTRCAHEAWRSFFIGVFCWFGFSTIFGVLAAVFN